MLGKIWRETQGIFQSFQIQKRVVGALLMREILDRWGRHNIGFLWMFGEPMLFTVGVICIWSIGGVAHYTSVSPVAFALTGYSTVLLWRNMPSRCLDAIRGNLTLMHYNNVRVIDIYAARVILEIMGVSMSLIILTGVFCFFEMVEFPKDCFRMIAAWFMLAWFGAALGITIGTFREKYDIVHTLWHPISYLIAPLSGSFFFLSAMPEKFRKVLLYIPTVHAVEMFRKGFLGDAFHAYYNPWYLLISCVVMTFVAMFQMNIISNRTVA
jgi:capsular polysaccharide transport system permease protein